MIIVNFLLSLELKKSYSSNQKSLHSRTTSINLCFRWPHYEQPRSHSSLTWLQRPVRKCLLLVHFLSWVGGLLMSGCCPSLQVTLWILTHCLPACLPACVRACVPACARACLPACLPAFLPSFLPVFLPSFLPSFLSSFLPAFLPSFLPVFLPSFLYSFLPSFIPSFLPSFLPRKVSMTDDFEPPATESLLD